jgi:hypothetical protein
MKIMKQEYIHNASTPPDCPFCCSNSSKPPEKIQLHQSVVSKQIPAYLKMKADLKKNEDKVMVVQDFTNISLSKGNRQCLCFCLYYSYEDKIKANYITYTAPDQDTKNDIRFVVGAWKKLILDYLLGFESILIWSDGGPKHFKITACMIFFAAIQTSLVGKKVEYHFFPSYHGHSVCDGMASHLKKKTQNRVNG